MQGLFICFIDFMFLLLCFTRDILYCMRKNRITLPSYYFLFMVTLAFVAHKLKNNLLYVDSLCASKGRNKH